MPLVKIVPYPPGIARLEAIIASEHRQVTLDIAHDAFNKAAVDTGEMRSTIRSEQITSFVGPFISRWLGRVLVGSDHWHFVEYGTNPHLIEPVRKQALHWPGARHPVARVLHPGTEPQPFMRPALYTRRRIGQGRL